MLYLIVYDITANKLRKKVADVLQAEGFERIQYSVFVGKYDPRQNEKLWKVLEKAGNTTEQGSVKIFVIPMLKYHFQRMLMLGSALPDVQYLSGDKHTLFI